MKTRSILLAGCIALALSPTLATAKDSHSAKVSFAKCPMSAVPADAPFGTIAANEGTTGGAATGILHAYVLAGSFAALAPNVIMLSAVYKVDAGPRSFTAHVVGRYDLNIGEAVLKGVVATGWLTGHKVVDTFHATPGGCVAGTLQLTPWPLDDDDD